MNVAVEPIREARYGNQASQRVLGLLSYFNTEDESRGVTELSRVTGMNKNMVHRALTTLVEAGYLVKDVTGERYQLGFRLLDLHVHEMPVDIKVLARASLEQLHAITGESVFLSIIVGSNRVNVDSIEGTGRRVSLAQRGQAVPLHVTKMSLLLLAQLTDDEVRRYLASAGRLDRHGDLFGTDEHLSERDLWTEIAALRNRPSISWQTPNRFDAAYASWPIPGAEGSVQGIVTVGGPRERFDPGRTIADPAVEAVIERLRQQCGFLVAAPVVFSGSGA